VKRLINLQRKIETFLAGASIFAATIASAASVLGGLQGNVNSFGFLNKDSSFAPAGQSVALTQLPREEDQHLFIIRERNPGLPEEYSLFLAERVGNNLIKKYIVLDTTLDQRTQNGQFRITTAYDPSVAWFRGRYWVAFECSSPDFYSQLAKVTASVCMAPLDAASKKVISSEIYVVLLGGQDPTDNSPVKYIISASVPKLLADDNRLYLYWSSVKIKDDPVVSNIAYNFKDIETYGVELLFNEARARPYPFVSFAHHQTNRLAYAWQKSLFTKILGISQADGFQTVADVFDIKKVGGSYYFTAGIGGNYNNPNDPNNSVKSNSPCIAPTIGYSNKGCYRLELFQASGPMQTLSNANRLSNTINYNLNPAAYEVSPWHEYSRLISGPDHKLNIVAHFNGSDQFRMLAFDDWFYYPDFSKSEITAGGVLDKFNGLSSPNKLYVLEVRDDGFAIRNTKSSRIVRQITTSKGSNGVFTLQSQGNLVYYPTWGSATGLWTPASQFSPGSRLVMQDDGNLVQYGPAGNPIWHSYGWLSPAKNQITVGETLDKFNGLVSTNGLYVLEVRDDGFAIRNTETMAIRRQIATPKGSNGVFTLQIQGNLVYYPTWGSATGLWTPTSPLSPGSRVVMQDDGNLVQYGPSNQVIWHSDGWISP
jgi:hypothetical protein